jgi:hypothetical protein
MNPNFPDGLLGRRLISGRFSSRDILVRHGDLELPCLHSNFCWRAVQKARDSNDWHATQKRVAEKEQVCIRPLNG